MGKGRATGRAIKFRGHRWKIASAAIASLALFTGWSGAGLSQASAATSAANPLTFSELSCTGPSFCIILGFHPRKDSIRPAGLLEEWNGRTWRVLPSPGKRLAVFSVTCSGPKFCLAYAQPLTGPAADFAWNGKAWRNFPQPPFDQLFVTCTSPDFCTTWQNTGDFTDADPQVANWNGKSWQVTDLPNQDNSGCGGPQCQVNPPMICGSSTNCTIQGSYCGNEDCDSTSFFYETWGGTSWTVSDETPRFDETEDCAGRSFCLSLNLPGPPAGTNRAEVTQDWGQHWSNASAGLDASCLKIARCGEGASAALSCGSPQSCMVLPSTLASFRPSESLRWNGSAWAPVPLAQAGGHIPYLLMLSCGNASTCVAVGDSKKTPSSAPTSVGERWNGTKWQVIPGPLATPKA